MTELPFHKLLNLVTFDQQAHKIQVELKNLHAEVAHTDTQVERLAEQLQVFKNRWQEAKHEVALQELAMRELGDAEKKAAERIETAHDTKEYSSLKKEIEYLKTKQHELEQPLLATWNTAETAEREYKNRQAFYDEELKKLETVRAEKRAQIEEHQKQVNQFQRERIEKIQDIPQQWLEKYERMQSRVPNPVVPAVNDSCSGCFYSLSAQDSAQLRNRALLQCKNCYRFLYLESVMQG